jgi:hypothetical protein
MLIFKMKGSEGDIYTVVAEKVGKNLTIKCSCPAGQNSTYCHHRIELLKGDTQNMISKNIDDVSRLKAMLKGSDVEVAMKELLVVEKREAEEPKRKVRAAKKNFAHAMDDGPAQKELAEKLASLPPT